MNFKHIQDKITYKHTDYNHFENQHIVINDLYICIVNKTDFDQLQEKQITDIYFIKINHQLYGFLKQPTVETKQLISTSKTKHSIVADKTYLIANYYVKYVDLNANYDYYVLNNEFVILKQVFDHDEKEVNNSLKQLTDTISEAINDFNEITTSCKNTNLANATFMLFVYDGNIYTQIVDAKIAKHLDPKDCVDLKDTIYETCESYQWDGLSKPIFVYLAFFNLSPTLLSLKKNKVLMTDYTNMQEYLQKLDDAINFSNSINKLL